MYYLYLVDVSSSYQKKKYEENIRSKSLLITSNINTIAV